MTLIKKSVSLDGHQTSVALEPEFWEALAAQAAQSGQSLAGLIGEIDGKRGDKPLASALRVWALRQAGLPKA